MSEWIGSPNYTKGRGGKKIEFYVVHWMAGTLAGTDSVFQKAGGVSAHKGIEDNTIHVYVKDEDTAYHAGNWDMNQRSLGTENSAAPGRPASPQTLENLAKDLAEAHKKYGIILDRQHVKRHGEIVPTQCCGTIDVDAIVRRAAEIVGTPLPQVPLARPAVPVGDNVVNHTAKVTVKTTANVRAYANTSAPLAGSKTLQPGQFFYIVGYTVAQDPYNDGRNIWLKSQYNNWVWAGNTDFILAKPAPAAQGGRVIVTATPFLYVRTQSKTTAALGGSQKLFTGTTVDYAQEVVGQAVNGNNIWYKSLYGNYFWSGGCRKY
jgi:hypothetical protein